MLRVPYPQGRSAQRPIIISPTPQLHCTSPPRHTPHPAWAWTHGPRACSTGCHCCLTYPVIVLTPRVHRQRERMVRPNRYAAHLNVPQRLDALGRGLVLLVAVAENPILAVFSREDFPFSPMAKAESPPAHTRLTRTPPNPSTMIGRSVSSAPYRSDLPQMKTDPDCVTAKLRMQPAAMPRRPSSPSTSTGDGLASLSQWPSCPCSFTPHE
jgi:hypothetical protein